MFGQNAYKNLESTIEAESTKTKSKTSKSSSGATIIKKPRDMSYMEYVDEKKRMEAHIEPLITGKGIDEMKPLFATPNSQHDHDHHHPWQDDYTKNYKNSARAERPGVCFLEGLENAPESQDLDNPSLESKMLGSM